MGMKSYVNLVEKYNELKKQQDDKIKFLTDNINSKEMLLQEKTEAYKTASDEEKEEVISSINTLKTEIQILQSQIKDEMKPDLKKDPEIKKLVREVEKEYYAAYDNARAEMAADVAELNKMILLLKGLYGKYQSFVDKTSVLNSEISSVGHDYMDECDTLLNYSKSLYINPDYMNPYGYVKYPELGRPEGLYKFASDITSVLNQFGLQYFQK